MSPDGQGPCLSTTALEVIEWEVQCYRTSFVHRQQQLLQNCVSNELSMYLSNELSRELAPHELDGICREVIGNLVFFDVVLIGSLTLITCCKN